MSKQATYRAAMLLLILFLPLPCTFGVDRITHAEERVGAFAFTVPISHKTDLMRVVTTEVGITIRTVSKAWADIRSRLGERSVEAAIKYHGVRESVVERWLGPWEQNGVVLRYILFGILSMACLLLTSTWSWMLRKRVREQTALLLVELSERQCAEQRIRKLNRLYALITQVDEVLVRGRDQAAIFREVCQLIIEYGPLAAVWIGLIDSSTRSVRPVAAWVKDGEFRDHVRPFTLEDLPEACGPSGIAVREGKHCIVNDTRTDPRLAPWRAIALDLGYLSSASFPLKVRDECVAVLSLYAAEPHFFDDDEEIALLVGVAGNISFALEVLDREQQRERAESALLESEERFRTAFDQAAIGVALTDSSTKIEAVNSALCEMLGYSHDELVGQSLMSDVLTFPEDLQISRKCMQSMLSGELSRCCWEERYIHKDGHLVWVQLVTSALRDHDGKPAQFIAQVQDITARKRAEADLRQSNWTLQAIVRASPVAIVALDPQGRVTAWNNASEQMFGWTAQEVESLPLPIVPADKTDEYQESLETVLGGAVFADKETKRQRKDGTLLDVSLSVAPLRDAEDRVAGVLAVYADVTERKRLEAQLLQSQKLESIGRLAGGVAHDFNNLLTVINCYTDLLLKKTDQQGSQSDALREIRKAGEQASTLTRQLLAFSRRQVLQPKVVNLGRIVEDLKEMLQRLLGEDIHLVVGSEKELGTVKADPGQLEQVIMNLAVNARDAMPSGGRLVIEIKNIELDERYIGKGADISPGCYVMLSVSDTGTGMNEETQRHLFEPFFTTKEAGKGTGLGLSMVWGIVKQSGGQICVYSELGKGTMFRIYLPRVEAHVVLERLPKRGAIPWGTETILLVEDQQQLRQLTSRILTDYGYHVLEASNGEEALLLCNRQVDPIHLVLTDVVMPGITGVELGVRLRESRPDIKVVCMSGYTDDVVFRQGTLEPSVAYLEKPFTPEGLAAKVREALGGPAVPQQLTAS